MSISINGVEFIQNPEIGFIVDDPKEINYSFNYPKTVRLIKEKRYVNLLFGKDTEGMKEYEKYELTPQEEETFKAVHAQEKAHPGALEAAVFRKLIQSDLWFLLYFIVKPFADDAGRAMVNHPFVVKACQEVEKGPLDATLDIWARFHFKSSIITTAETIQYQLKNPDHATGIFSHKAPIAKDFLTSIKSIFENEKILHVTHPDVVWQDPKREAPLWSLDEGIVLKRKTTRREASVSAHGLVEGMPVGLHFERRIYDDITTADIAESPDIIEKVNDRFDASQNLQTLVGGHHRVVGTYYSHNDPLIYVRNKKDLEGKPMYLLRLKPATEDGTANGIPVLQSQESLDKLKGDRSFPCQQLLDPTPRAEMKLHPEYLRRIEHEFIPKTVYKFMLIDQAGDAPSNKARAYADSWAIGIFDVEPFVDDVGQSNVYIEDLWVEVSGESEAIDQAVRMYLAAGMISKLGVEKVGTTTTHLHVANALKARGRYVEFSDSGTDRNYSGVLLRPAGRNKKKFIEGAIAWPLNNSKIFYSSRVPSMYIDRLKQEMSNHPLWHDDGLNVMAYLYDILRDYNFPKQETEEEKVRRRLAQEKEQSYNPLTFGFT